MGYKEVIAAEIEGMAYRETPWVEIGGRFWRGALNGTYVLDKGKASAIPYNRLFCQPNGTKGPRALVGGIIMARFHALVGTGQAHWGRFHLGTKAVGDADKKSANQILTRLPEAWGGQFYGGAGVGDGWICYSNNGHTRGWPLEMGGVRPETLWDHYVWHGGFARWPKQSEWLYILTANGSPSVK